MPVFSVEQLNTFTPETMPKPSETEIGDFYVRLGIAISSWQHVEELLFQIYLKALQQRPTRQVSAAYHSITGFRNRLATIQSVVDVSDWASPVISDWERIKKACERKSRRRNQLAHGVVVFDFNASGEKLYLRSSVEKPVATKPKAFPTNPSDKIGAKELDEMIGSFDALHEDIHSFAISIQ